MLLAALASYFLITNARVAGKQQQVGEDSAASSRRSSSRRKRLRTRPTKPSSRSATAARARSGVALGRRVAWDRLMRDVSLVLPADVLAHLGPATSATPTDATSAGGPPPDPDRGAERLLLIFSRANAKEAAERRSALAPGHRRLPEIASVKLVNATSTEVGDETVVQFTITATLKATTPGPTT